MEEVKKQGMESLFVPYEIALALKELGFDEPCFGKYLSSFQSDWKVYELILEMGMNEEFEDNRNVYLLEGACSAPTFSQAFRWFREKYGYDISIKKCTPSEYKFEIEQLFVEGDNYYFIDFVFKTYEEAELACLKKLIEIVKK